MTVLGSGLTAVDVVVALAARGYRGRISLLSRGGVLSYVWQCPTGRRPTHVTVERVAELRDTRGGSSRSPISPDCCARRWRRPARTSTPSRPTSAPRVRPTGSAVRLRQQLVEVGDARIGRRVLQETAHSVGPYAWRLLCEPDRAWLRRHLRTAASVVSPMVPVNAAVLLRLLDSGQLTVSSGVRAVEPVNGRFRIRHVAGERTTSALVNAVNAAPQAVPAWARDLAHSLTHAGLATPHPAGVLVPTDPRLYVVGDLAGGGPFLTSSIAGVAAQAARVAGVLGGR